MRRQRGVRLSQNANEVFCRQGLELNADGKASLQFRNQVRRLGHMERTGSNEQDVVRLDHAVLGVDRRALDEGQQITLHAFARYVRTLGFRAACDLVDLVEEHDTVLFHGLERL